MKFEVNLHDWIEELNWKLIKDLIEFSIWT